MKIMVRFLFSILIAMPALLVAQAPIARFSGSDTAICDSSLAVNFTDLSSNNPTSWKWYFPGATSDTSTLKNPTNIQYKGYGCYTVKLVVKNKYGSDSLTDSNYICLDAPPHIKLTGTTACMFANDTIKATGGTSYYWSDGSTNSYIVVAAIVNRTYKIRVYNGVCYKDSVFNLKVDSAPPPLVENSRTICAGDSIVIYAIPSVIQNHYDCSFLWSTGSTTDSIIIDSIKPGVYKYYVTIAKGACLTDPLPIIITVDNCTGIENYYNPAVSIHVYPNPSNGQFTIALSHPVPPQAGSGSQTKVEVYNVLGEQVYSRSAAADDNLIDLSKQPDGVYFYRVLTQAGNLIGQGKLVIEK